MAAPPDSDRWAEAYVAVVSALGDKKRSWRLRFILWRQKSWLQHHAKTWGEVTYALATNKMTRQLVHWALGWEKREGLAAWNLLNLVDALMRRGDMSAAMKVVERATRLPPDHTTPWLEIWQAYLLMLDGKTSAARAIIRRNKATTVPPFYQYVHGLAEAVVMVLEAPSGDRAAVLRDAKNLIEDRRDKCRGSRQDRFHLKLYRHAIRVMGAGAADWRTRLQSYNPANYLSISGSNFAIGQNRWLWWMIIFITLQMIRVCSEHGR